MGTLTADVPRLTEHCDHKLPTSCRLTSTPLCCACADERQHTSTYRVYIDGIGFVHRGTRWQNYCWFCREFWEARVAASGLTVSQTQIPDRPDQRAFLDRWFEFYQGYRIVRTEDGREERIAVVGEPLRDVDPGHLPRTLDELRSGRVATEQEAEPALEGAQPDSEVPQPSLDQTLDALLDEMETEEAQSYVSTSETAPTIPVVQPSTSSPAAAFSEEPYNSTSNRQFRAATRRLEEAQAARIARQAEVQAAAAEERAATLEVRRARRPQVSLPNFAARVFGTREDILSDGYISPLTTMFTRPPQRSPQTEAQRRELETQQRVLGNFEEIHRGTRGAMTVPPGFEVSSLISRTSPLREDGETLQDGEGELEEWYSRAETPTNESSSFPDMQTPPGSQSRLSQLMNGNASRETPPRRSSMGSLRRRLDTQGRYDVASPTQAPLQISQSNELYEERMRLYLSLPRPTFHGDSSEQDSTTIRARRLEDMIREYRSIRCSWDPHFTPDTPDSALHEFILENGRSRRAPFTLSPTHASPSLRAILPQLNEGIREILQMSPLTPRQDVIRILQQVLEESQNQNRTERNVFIPSNRVLTSLAELVTPEIKEEVVTLLADIVGRYMREDLIRRTIPHILHSLPGELHTNFSSTPPTAANGRVPLSPFLPQQHTPTSALTQGWGAPPLPAPQAPPAPPRGLDINDDRPSESATEEAMTVSLKCQICYSQVADVACLPCGHLSMCRWCADQAVPTLAHHRKTPVKGGRCPVCRSVVEKRVRIYVG